MLVRPRSPADEAAVEDFLAASSSTRVARLGQLVAPLDHPALIAEIGGRLAGVLTYLVADEGCEILTLHATPRGRGTGTALVEAVEELCRQRGWGRLWVLTTNDNLDAVRFYQRRGFRLAMIRPGGADLCRACLKPEIPLTGNYGIPIRDELVLEKHP